jgi:hypothetical protein
LRGIMPKQINEPTREGFEMGYYMARFADAEESAGGKLANGRERCATCAFRQGTYPNGSVQTQMDALKCVMEGVPFNCHEDTEQPCAGWALLRRVSEIRIQVLWRFSDE